MFLVVASNYWNETHSGFTRVLAGMPTGVLTKGLVHSRSICGKGPLRLEDPMPRASQHKPQEQRWQGPGRGVGHWPPELEHLL